MMKPFMTFLAVWGLGLTMALAGPVYEPLTAFQAGPAGPENSGMLKHSDGFFYGTSRGGGAYGNGTIYQVSQSGELTVLVHFTGNIGQAKGRRPQAGLVDDGSGVLWGTTIQGGAGNFGDGFGTVFRFNPVTRDFTMSVAFTGPTGFAKGSFPQAGLERDGMGQLWGATSAGGAGGAGTLFKINHTSLVFTSVLDFTGTTGANRGRSPLGTLVHDGAGLLWGTTAEGGSNGLGTLFSVDAATAGLTTLVDFMGISGAFRGNRPVAALRAGEGGTFWGTTNTGGAAGQGTVFRYTVAGSVFTTVAEFTGGSGAVPGREPATTLVPDGSGFLFGTTNAGGADNYGTIFKIQTNTLVFSNIASFTGLGGAMPGSVPYATLTADGAGFLWGNTTGGGASQLGTVYKIDPATGTYALVADFAKTLGATASSNPGAGLTAGLNGLLWGTTGKGGAVNVGTVFTVHPVTGATSSVVELTGTTGEARGSDPTTELVSDGAGFFWGTTASGGMGDYGTVFKINETTKVFTSIVEFNGRNGRGPAGRLQADGSGFFWGTTAEGGIGFAGTIFKVDMATGALTTVVEFTGSSGAFTGDGPEAGLTPDGAGFFWGTTHEGGENGLGTVFKIVPSTGVFTSLLSFTGSGGTYQGDGPAAALVADTSGFLWGTTGFGGSDGQGTVFKVHHATEAFTTVVEFTGPSGTRAGINPKGSLIQDPLGAWYGTTDAGGAADLGTVFKITPDGLFSTIYEFTGSLGAVPGEKPRGAFVLSSDGNFYGTTSAGGSLDALNPAGNGQIYRLRFGPSPVTMAATPVLAASAVLRGTVNPNGAASTVTFEYSTSSTLAGATVVAGGSTGSGVADEDVSAALSGLAPSTTYYFRVLAKNAENLNLQTGGLRSFRTSAGQASGFVNWLNAAGVPGGAEEAGNDADLDGLPNAIEFILGGNPGIGDNPAGPSLNVTPDHLIFTFLRQDASETPGVTLTVEAGAVLSSWPSSSRIGSTSVTSSGGVTVDENGTDPDLVTVNIPRNGNGVTFARLKVSIDP